MSEWWYCIAAICLAVPLAMALRLPPLCAGLFCLGLELIFKYWGT